MQQPKTRDPFAADGELHTALSTAAMEIASMREGEQRTWALRGLATLLIGAPDTFRASAVQQCPDLEDIEPIPDTHLNIDEQEIASRVTEAELQAIDGALIAGSVTSWRKVARVVGDALVMLNGQIPGLPLGLCVQRVEVLVQRGELLAQGNTQFMRLGEVRLPAGGTSAAL